MSMAEILNELPRLTAEERTMISHRLRELEEKDQALFLHEAAVTMFREIDQSEGDESRSKTR